MLAIIDYKAGNLTSVRRALDYQNIPCLVTADPEQIAASQGIIFPGVGAAGSAMNNLKSANLDRVIKEQIAAEKPLLGICLGCQIVLEQSQEDNNTQTLGLFPGSCERFSPELCEEDGQSICIPHMGWNSVFLEKPCPLFKDVSPESEFYFVHSYFPNPNPEFVIGTTIYGLKFCSVLGRDNLWAMQFHPEKSGRPGLKILSNFASYCQEKANA